MVRDVQGTAKLYNELIEEIIKTLKKLYGSYWDFEIDLEPGFDIERRFVLRIKVSRKGKK